MSWVAQTGVAYLAFATLSGWLLVVVVERPEWLSRAGVRAPGRFRQAHIDWILMALILIAVGLAVPELGTVWQVLLVAGTIVNPALFVPMAFRPEVRDHVLFRGVSIASFTAMSLSTVAAAVTAIA